ncbi:reverse transcriptase [Cucumis melo var. makuwa]|uniref:Reverse transcriptase n=1 Tax=Cucumis melo var. makuwa TaxID=1194695 RepID=A0A5A7T425_CUCMM|nr:reverse transcriptase [Cucumis melo var. makuwa]
MPKLFSNLSYDFRATIETIKVEMFEMKMQVNLTMQAVGNQTPNQVYNVSSRLKILEHKAFNENSDAKELENLIFDMEQYFKASGSNSEKPRRKLQELKHIRTIIEYVKQFSSIMLDIQDMSEKDKVFYFEELKPLLPSSDSTRGWIEDHMCNKVFHEYLNQFVVVYLDDIVVFGSSLEELQVTSSNAKRFEWMKMNYEPLRSGEPPLLILKKGCTIDRVVEERYDLKMARRMSNYFDNLKVTMTRGSIFGLVDMSKLFIVETDVSNFALGGVLTQEGHPIAYESHKLNSAERRYTVSEKEMLVVVHYLRALRQYLLRSPFVVKSDNIVISHFFSQPKLTSKQAR